MRQSVVFIFVLASLLSCGVAERETGKTLVLDNIESESSLGLWEGPVALSREYAAQGKSCLKLDLSDRRFRYLRSEKLAEDWSAYDLLKFDIYNPNDRIQIGSLQIFDELASDEEASIEGLSYRGRKVFLNKGWNHFELKLQTAMVENGDRPLALDKIRRFLLNFGGTGGELFLDNFRLVKGEESVETASRVEPGHCRVVIDNRYVYPQLAGPLEKIVPGPRVRQLRAEAEKQVARLKKQLDLVTLQGYQTYYWRIPLIVADIGMGIRSKCVWFQNEEEEKKILEYVISSCAGTCDELEDVLTARGEMAEDPSDEVNPQLLYVPPYPDLKGLKQWGGYFRDSHGEPVIILSMLNVNRGPLMDYFAPFNHRLESYTVGGGSRYDIESSPVYEAFHKYPGTQRVGWDGWCGHLIKDRWSMGGRKENVVICLESPHIREAVLEYMKTRYNLWKENPNLLYNIMAYELMYICYCEKSQQMFRDWLRKKHGSIGEVNRIWGTGYRSFGQIEAPAVYNAAPVSDVNRAAWYDWSFFNTRRFTDYLKWTKEQMRKLDLEVPICAGGTSSMLSSGNSTSGIDEEMIINEVDDVILNESGSSHIFSDLFLSLSEHKKAMVEPEMGGGVHGMLLHFLHGKSSIAKWHWPRTLSREFPGFAQSSIPHSWDITLPEVAEVLRLGLDVRRLRNEIAAFTAGEPEIAIFYSKSSILQVPPQQVRAGRTPYLNAVFAAWSGSRFLGCRIGFVSEKQILAGKLAKFKLLIIPAVKYIPPEVADAVFDYTSRGGTAVIVPEAFLFDQYARQNDRLAGLGLKIEGVTLPPVLGEGERVQNYDQSITQTIVYGEVKNTAVTEDRDIFRGRQLTFQTEGLVQNLDPGGNSVLASFENGRPALVLLTPGKGRIYYLASPPVAADYHELLCPLAEDLGLTRPVLAVDSEGKPVTGAEVRAVECDGHLLVYACNLSGRTLEFDLESARHLGEIKDLRSIKSISTRHVNLSPFEETIFRIEQK
jgi:Beta-galactosidase/Beta-galactosidase trimerisation domain